MAKTNDKLDRGVREGHGDSSKPPSIRKGEYMPVGTCVELSTKAISPNVKSGSGSGGETGGV